MGTAIFDCWKGMSCHKVGSSSIQSLLAGQTPAVPVPCRVLCWQSEQQCGCPLLGKLFNTKHDNSVIGEGGGSVRDFDITLFGICIVSYFPAKWLCVGIGLILFRFSYYCNWGLIVVPAPLLCLLCFLCLVAAELVSDCCSLHATSNIAFELLTVWHTAYSCEPLQGHLSQFYTYDGKVYTIMPTGSPYHQNSHGIASSC